MNKEEIIKSWNAIALSLRNLYKNNDVELVIKKDLFKRLLKKLPEVSLVAKRRLDDWAVIVGTINLYTDLEFYKLSGEERERKTFSFIFFPENAFIYRGYYFSNRREEIFSGDWVGVLDFILKELIKKPQIEALTSKQEKALEELTKQLKSKKGK